MGCSTKCCSIENGGVLVSEARSRRVGGPARSGLIDVGLQSLIVDPWRIFWERRVGKEKSYENPNRLEKTGGQVAAWKRMSTCCPFRSG